MGKFAGRFHRFPLLLKFLDVREMLSVQVHPTDPATAKTEAWVVLEAGIKSRIYAGLKPGTTEADLRTGAHRTERWRTTSHASIRSPATLSSIRLGWFTRWAAASWCSRSSRTVT